MTVVGYARVSTREQNPAAQEAELRAAGAERVFVDHGESSRAADRRSGWRAATICVAVTRWCSGRWTGWPEARSWPSRSSTT